jgi:hypothetical protein
MRITPAHLDSWRIIPRLLIGMYCIAFWDATQWFMGLEDPTNAQAGFVSTIVGAGAAWFGLYVSSKSNKEK